MIFSQLYWHCGPTDWATNHFLHDWDPPVKLARRYRYIIIDSSISSRPFGFVVPLIIFYHPSIVGSIESDDITWTILAPLRQTTLLCSVQDINESAHLSSSRDFHVRTRRSCDYLPCSSNIDHM